MSVVELNNQITFAIGVTDRYASAKWYEEMLGFELRMHIDEAGWSELSTKTDNVTLGLGEQMEMNSGNSMPVFGVSDVHEARRALEEKGVKFDGETMVVEGMVSLATFYDPDGNAMMLAQDLSS